MATRSQIESLIEQLADFRTRAEAKRRLTLLGEECVEQLLVVLGNMALPTNMRWAAMGLLTNLGCMDAVQDIFNILQSEVDLQNEAAICLQKLTGMDCGVDAKGWATKLGLEHLLLDVDDDEGDIRDMVDDILEGEVMMNEDNNIEEDAVGKAKDGDELKEQEQLPLACYEKFRDALGDRVTNCNWVDDSYVHIRVPLDNGRKQQIVVTFNGEDEGGRLLAQFYSESGVTTVDAQAEIEERNGGLRYGEFRLVPTGDDDGMKVTISYTAVVAELDVEAICEVVLYLAQEADNLEKELTNEDLI